MSDEPDIVSDSDGRIEAAMGRLADSIDRRTYDGPAWEAILRRRLRRRIGWTIASAASAAVAAGVVLAVLAWSGGAGQPHRDGDRRIVQTQPAEIEGDSLGLALDTAAVALPDAAVSVGWELTFDVPTINFDLSERSSDDETQQPDNDSGGGAGSRPVDLL